MATDRAQQDSGSRSGVDGLLGEVSQYLAAQAGNLADKVSDKLGDITDQLSDAADNPGSIADIGGRILKGDSPLKAAATSTFDNVKDKVKGVVGGGSGGKGSSRKAGAKPTHICEFIDVGVPLRTAYDHWTQYEDFSGFAKGVRSVSKNDETTSDWKVKVGPSTRSWKASIQEQVPDERIEWSSSGAKGTTRGCVSFHELAPSLTRVLVVVEYYPSGFFEKTGNIWRAQGRRLRLDLKHYVRHVTLTDKEPDGWRGEIRDGEVVRTHEEAVEEEEAAAEEEEAEPGSEEEPEDSADAYEDEEAGEDEEDQEDADRDGYEDAYEESEDDDTDLDEGEAEGEYDDEYEDEEAEEEDEEPGEDEDEEETRPTRRRKR
ncbi:SRPBCC family protein [Streptomyces sp. NPDC059491]|uniref:SRPBCC family protein n=1 Tax=Streptomyces sp. NPDC059491 TaxID=3346850 RepID=UPI0036896157